MTSFPIGSSVCLHGLKSAQYNDKRGIVRSNLDPMSNRQEVYLIDLEKNMAIKPTNMKYETRELTSLSIAEMKGLLLASNKKEEELQGLDKTELQKMVANVSTNPEEIAALVAKANAPASVPSVGNNNNASDGSFTSDQLRHATDRMSQMNPEQLRQQAATMKAMGPAAMRNMNPQMAHMTDEQITMAINQMEAMANNPEMMKMATEQMKNMGENELRQAMGSNAPINRTPSAAATRPASSTTNNTTNSSVMNDTIKNMNSDQLKEASQKISSMSPEQLKSQAAMLKNMPIETLRRTNPHMANMTEDQIKMAINQMESMANNPELMKMASEQMKNMDEKQLEQVKEMCQSGVGGMGSNVNPTSSTSSSSTNGLPSMEEAVNDPSKMMESLLSNPEQLSGMIKSMKQNPDLIKSLMRSQMGCKEGENDPKAEQIEKAIDQFTGMSDQQLDKYIRYANTAQGVFQPVLSSFNKAKAALGVSSRTMIVLINLLIVGGITAFVMWVRSRGEISVHDADALAELQTDDLPEIVSGHDESEF